MKHGLISLVFLLLPVRPAPAADSQLTLALARQLAQAAQDCAQQQHWHLSVAIVNAEGNLLLFERGDGANIGSIDAALAKARSANAFQRPTSAFVQSVKEGRLQLLSVPGIVALEGGVPLVLEGQHAGALGISGARATEDESCALAALKALTSPPPR